MTSSSTLISCPLIEKALEYIGEDRLEKFLKQVERLREHYGPEGAILAMQEAGIPAELDALAHRAYGSHACSEARAALETVRELFGHRPIPVTA